MLILLGYKLLKQQDEVLVTTLKDAMEKTGFNIDRVDRLTDSYIDKGLILKGGKGKGGKYSLTNSGQDDANVSLEDMLSKLT
jgi:hypothetical protein